MVTQSRRPGLIPFNLVLDPDSGPDPSPDLPSVQSRILCEPEEVNIFMFDIFYLLNPDFSPVVVFLDCPLHRGHRASCKCNAQMTADQSGKVRIRVLDSDPVTQQLFYQCVKENLKAAPYRTVRNADPDADAGSVVRCCAVPRLFMVPVRGRTH